MRPISSHVFLTCIVVSLSIVLRLIIAGFGFTYDMESYQIVGKIVTTGGNVYSETTRYNYGPVWFSLLGLVYVVSQQFTDSFLVFRFLITAFLILVDVSIWFILYKRYSFRTGVLFLLSPISIVLTGYYSQFDNFAIFLGLVSMILLERSKSKKIDRNFICAALLLGVSLTTKHIFFLFPLWLFFSQSSWKKRFGILAIPLLVFGFGFLPFLRDGLEGIIKNVFLYSSFNNAPLWQFLVPDYLKRLLRKEFLFFGTLVVGAVVFRKKYPLEQILYYSIILVIFSYAIADQYLAIVIPFISVFFNIFFLGFIVVQSLFFLMILQGGEVNWLGFLLDRQNFGFTVQILMLFSGFLFVLYRERFPHFSFLHVKTFLIFCILILYGGIVFPSLLEDRRIQPIEQAIKNGDYELANQLYVEIERNPPFAGSRFYEKLRGVRFNIEYYRIYRNALDGYENQSLERDWKKITKELEHVPQYFPDKERVEEIINFGKINYD